MSLMNPGDNSIVNGGDDALIWTPDGPVSMASGAEIHWAEAGPPITDEDIAGLLPQATARLRAITPVEGEYVFDERLTARAAGLSKRATPP
jgi:hypothetical protein